MIHLGRWQDTIDDIVVDSVITDPPYGERVHTGARSTGHDDGIAYKAWTPSDVHEFVASWALRTRRWIVAMTSHDLIPAWEVAYAKAKLYPFAPVPIIMSGMGVRQLGDGPASWGIYLMVARQRSREKMRAPTGALWRSLPGGYWGPANSGGYGRGKPEWLTGALVRDYSDAGDLVCDPFAGWGTTLTAALGYGRRVIGSEVDAEAFAVATKALAAPNQVEMYG